MQEDNESLIVDPNPSESIYLSEEEKLAKEKESLDAMYWINQVVTTAKLEQQPWFDECKSAWREFSGQRLDGTWRPTKLWWAEVYPRYWSDTELMQPALYSRTPKVVSRRKFSSKDPVARTGTIINDRLAEWLISTGDYDRTMEMCALGFLNTNRQTARVFFQDRKVKRKARKVLSPVINEQGIQVLVDDTNTPVPDDVAILTDEDGRPFYELETDEEVSRPRVISKPVQFDKLRISPGARNESEIWWIAYQITCSKKDAAKLFGEKIKDIPQDQPSGVSSSDWDTDTRVKKSNDLFTYWEVWNKRDNEVYWLNESYKQGFLKKDTDIYELEGFFPSPKFMMDNMRYDSCYPAPDYTQCKDAYEQIHILYKRINQTVRAIKAAILFDGSEADLANFFREITDNEGIGVSKWAETAAEGGFESKIFIPDFSRLAQVLQVQIEAFERQKQAIDELRGITDLIRGASDPSTSATAEKIKDRRSSLRFAKKKKAMLKFAVETLQMMLDLAYKTFDVEYIKDIVGFNQMEAGDQQRFEAAIAILKNDEERVIRIDIETDSMVLFEDMNRKEQAIEALNVIGGYVQNISQGNPILLPPMVLLLEKVIRSMEDTRDAEDPINQAFQQMMNQANQPPQPPQPNPDVLAKINSDQAIRMAEIQAKERIEMAKLGKDYTKINQDGSLKGAELQIKAGDQQIKLGDLQQKGMSAQTDAAIKIDNNRIQREWMQLEAEGGIADAQLKASSQMLKAQELALKGQSEQQKAAIEGARIQIEQALAALKQYEVTLSEQEKMLTEQRLQAEAAHMFEQDRHEKDLEATEIMKEVELVKATEATKQIEAISKTKEAPEVQVIIPSGKDGL